MRLTYLTCLLTFLTSTLLADSLKDLYDPVQQINRDKKSTLAQREFKTKNFAFHRSALFFDKSLTFNQTAKSKRLTWDQTSLFFNRKFEKPLPVSLWGEHQSSMKLNTFAWQNKTAKAPGTYEVKSAKNLTFQEASGFSANYPVQEYKGSLPVNVSKSLQSKKEKILTIEEIKEILNKNK